VKTKKNDKGIALAGLAKADSRTQDLVKAVQSILMKGELELAALKDSLIALFEYLTSEHGRTDVNCGGVDLFFMFDDLWVERNLPDAFHDIFADMAGALHDTMSAPEIAENFDSTPEQLLKRARKLNTEPASAPDAEE
jgi:hypothetical protein